MAYDAAKAHEYYLKYKKKGLKKGRKKGTSSQKKTNLVGLATGGLNDQGKMQWALAKEKLSKEMNEALSKAKTQEEKDKIRADYQNKALQQLQGMKNDASLAKAKSTKASTGSKGSSKGSSSKGGSGRSGGSSGGSKSSGGSSNSGGSAAATPATTQGVNTDTALMVAQVQDMVAQLSEKLASLTDEQKANAKAAIQNQIEILRKRLAGG